MKISFGAPPDLGALAQWPRLWSVVNLAIFTFGALSGTKSVQPVVLLFWVETAIALAAALIRMLAAGGGGKNVGDALFQKMMLLAFGIAIGFALLALSAAFSYKALEGPTDAAAFAGFRFETWALALNYGGALAARYFLNGRRAADPVSELAAGYARALIILFLLMPLTMHILPRFSQLDEAVWAGLAVVFVKFAVDWFWPALEPLAGGKKIG